MINLASYHKSRTGRYPENPPKRFTDKVFWRKMNDRRPILTDITDKLKVKQIAGQHAIPTLNNPSYPFIAKPNNYSGQTAIIHNDKEFQQYLKRWDTLKNKTYGQNKGEWAYKNITPKLIFEPVITDFWELKAYVFDGKVECFYICGKGSGRPESNGISYFWPDGSPINVIHNNTHSPFDEVPFEFTEALEIVEKLTPSIDFVRTDLMITDDKIYISEFTLYPGSGCIDFKPDEFDYTLGGFWDI